ncbi:hypothetical protein GCM10010840_33990 [Deinococcus aerolatus]|uniref:Uncharacterized protein n=1 Tax=Deinococcus aerolatus TaxID=522487 RepID=A0ABQ2GFX3_9DEIO|nr:hypothetical protein [Deinococcus aerolatus]GGL93162.1 hypothetical protein GCM10010840_33990 [Deinococcus aerolatus]
MTPIHGATRQRDLREILGHAQVMTTAQLRRHDLMPLSRPLTLPQQTYTVATRTTQQASQYDLTFVALDEAILRQHTPAELGHLAGLTEAWLRVGEVGILQFTGLTHDHRWHLVQPEERQQGSRDAGRSGHLPDAAILSPAGYGDDWAVELDAGYPRARKIEKMTGFAQQGYRHILWVTTVHGLVRPIVREMQRLRDDDELPGVVSGAALFADYWSERDPYRPNRRCHTKSLFAFREL